MEINQLKYFKAVADSGKIISAAKELYLSPAAISASISALEQELNVELFHRTGNRLSLNRQGKIFLDYANHILESVTDAKSDLIESLRDPKKNIVVGATSSIVFADCFSAFTKAFPDISLTTSQIPLRYINSAGLNSRFSFLLSAESEIPDAYAEACDYIELFTDRPALMLHPLHSYAKKERILPEELAGKTLIWPRINHGLPEKLSAEFSSRYLPMPVFSIHHLAPAYALVKNNLGMALMTEHSNSILSKDLIFVPIELPALNRKQRLYWKKDLSFTEEDRIFLQFIQSYYNSDR